MLVSSVSSFHPNRVVGLTPKRNENDLRDTAFAGLSTSTTQVKKVSVPVLVMLASMFLGILALVNCKQIGSEPIQTQTPTTIFVPTKTPGPTQTSGATAPPLQTSTPTKTATPTVAPTASPTATATTTQPSVQTGMSNIGTILGLNLPSSEITNISYYDGSEDTTNALVLNTNESSVNERVYDGISMDSKTTKYVRNRVTFNDGLVVKKYETLDGNPPSETTTWKNYANFKYIPKADASGVEKYSLNPDDSIKELSATISPDTGSSLIATTPAGDVYPILDIVLN